MQKSIFKSKGVIGSAITVGFGFLTLIQSPAFHGQASECLKIFGQNDLANAIATLSPLLVMAGGVLAGYGRIDGKTRLYTPKWMPGPNKLASKHPLLHRFNQLTTMQDKRSGKSDRPTDQGYDPADYDRVDHDGDDDFSIKL